MCILGGHRKWRLWSILYQIKQWFFFLKSSKTYNHLLSYSKIIYSTFFKKITEIKFYDENDNFIVAFSQLLHFLFFIHFFFLLFIDNKNNNNKKGEREENPHTDTKATIYGFFTIKIFHCSHVMYSSCCWGIWNLYTGVFFGMFKCLISYHF